MSVGQTGQITCSSSSHAVTNMSAFSLLKQSGGRNLQPAAIRATPTAQNAALTKLVDELVMCETTSCGRLSLRESLTILPETTSKECTKARAKKLYFA